LWQPQPNTVELAKESVEVFGVPKQVSLNLENHAYSVQLELEAPARQISLKNIVGRYFLDLRCWFDPKSVSKGKTCQQIQMIVGPYKVVVREDARIEVKAKFKGEHVANKVLSQVKDCLLRSGERIIDTFDVVAGNVVASAELGRNVKIRALLRDRRDGTKLEDDNNGKAVLVIGETPPVAAAAAAVAAAASAAAAVAAAAAAGGGGAAATDGAGETKEEAFQQKVVVSNNGTIKVFARSLGDASVLFKRVVSKVCKHLERTEEELLAEENGDAAGGGGTATPAAASAEPPAKKQKTAAAAAAAVESDDDDLEDA